MTLYIVVPPGIEPGTQGQFIDNVSPLLYQLSYGTYIYKKESLFMSNSFMWCHQESNRGHKDFQSFALPTELWHVYKKRVTPKNDSL